MIKKILSFILGIAILFFGFIYLSILILSVAYRPNHEAFGLLDVLKLLIPIIYIAMTEYLILKPFDISNKIIKIIIGISSGLYVVFIGGNILFQFI